MKLEGLVKTVEEMSDEELMERLRSIRHNRDVIRPASKQRAERVEKKTVRAKLSAVDKLLGKLSEAEREALLAQLNPTEGAGDERGDSARDSQDTQHS